MTTALKVAEILSEIARVQRELDAERATVAELRARVAKLETELDGVYRVYPGVRDGIPNLADPRLEGWLATALADHLPGLLGFDDDSEGDYEAMGAELAARLRERAVQG